MPHYHDQKCDANRQRRTWTWNSRATVELLTGSGWLSDCIPPRPLSLPPLSTPLPLRTIYRCCFCYTLAASVGARCLGSSAWPRPHVRGVRLISKNVKIANRKTVKSNKSNKKQQQQQRQRQRQRQRAKLICMHN